MTQWKNNIGTRKGRRGGGEEGVRRRGQREASLGRILGICGMWEGTMPACPLLQHPLQQQGLALLLLLSVAAFLDAFRLLYVSKLCGK